MIAAFIDGLKYARWLTRARTIVAGQVLMTVQLSILTMLALWQHGVIAPEVSKTSSDFVSFYAAGKLALAGTPMLAYDQAAHYAMEQQFAVQGSPYQFFFYPPVFLLLCAPLALLPYYVSFYVFELTTLAAFVMVMRRVLEEKGWEFLGPGLAFPAIFWTMGLGQNAFLTAALLGGFTVLLDRRPISAGMLLGLVCYKPHFGLLAPIGLLFARRWHAFFAGGATMAAVVLLSLALFGAETWHAYLAAFAGSDAVYAGGRIDYAGMETPFGAARLMGLAADRSYMVQALVTGGMALLVGLIWKFERRQSVRAASLLAATLLAVPMALLYDKLLLLVAIGWLVREGRRRGYLPWEKTVLMAAWPASLVTWIVGSAWHVPLGPLVSFAVLILCVRRVELLEVTRAKPVAAGAA